MKSEKTGLLAYLPDTVLQRVSFSKLTNLQLPDTRLDKRVVTMNRGRWNYECVQYKIDKAEVFRSSLQEGQSNYFELIFV